MPGRPFGPIFTFFDMWGHTADVINPVKFQVDWSKGLGAMGTPNRVFPIDFDRRPYNSVTNYRATLWCVYRIVPLSMTLSDLRL